MTNANVKYFEIIQSAGETVFVPSGWFHQVWNEGHTISINHNWFNATNVFEIWLQIYETYKNVLHEIHDCRDMEDFNGHCQLMLKASYGINFEDFFNLLEVILRNRLECLTEKCNMKLNDFVHNENHCHFDIKVILNVLQLAQPNLDSYTEVQQKCSKLIKSIENVCN